MSLLARSLHGSTESTARRTVRVVLGRDPRGSSPTAAQVLRATPDVPFYLAVRGSVCLHTHTRISLLRSAYSSLSSRRISVSVRSSLADTRYLSHPLFILFLCLPTSSELAARLTSKPLRFYHPLSINLTICQIRNER